MQPHDDLKADETGDRLLDEAMGWLLALRDAPDDMQRRAEHEQWLAADSRHARAWERAQQVWVLAGQTPLAPVQASEPPQALPVITPRRKPPQRQRWLAAGMAVAAMVLVTIMAPSLWLSWQSDYQSSRAEIRQLRLDDGSLMTVGADSAIRVSFSEKGREIHLLKGQAFFDVAEDERPFSVMAGDVRITDIGTAFDVVMSGDNISVAVENGEVAIAAPGQPVVSLHPGQRARLDRHAYFVEQDEIPPSLVAAWRHGQLLVENQRIEDVVQQLRPYARGMIVLRDTTLANRRVTGSYSLKDPAAALRAIVQPWQGSVREVSPWLLVVSSS